MPRDEVDFKDSLGSPKRSPVACVPSLNRRLANRGLLMHDDVGRMGRIRASGCPFRGLKRAGDRSMATDEERKRAYKAFKKKLKLARLDDHSGLSPGSKTSHIGG